MSVVVKTEEPSSHPMDKLLEHFFTPLETLQSTILTLCQNNLHSQDNISFIISVMLTCPLQIHLLSNGLQMFKGKDVFFPYQHMSTSQREFLLDLLSQSKLWTAYENCMICLQTKPMNLDTLQVLQALCQTIQSSSKYPDPRHRLAIMNILLQRIHSKVAIKKQVQVQLNKFLFDKNQIHT